MTKKIRKHERKVIFNFYPIKKLAVLKTISYRESVAFEVFLLPEVIVSQSVCSCHRRSPTTTELQLGP